MCSSDVDAVVDNKVYIGNLAAATSSQRLRELGITHVLSVCPEVPNCNLKHLNIPVQDSEYEDLLIKLPEACEFIQSSLNQGGRVLVHCVMGISRSATVVCAYLMQTWRIGVMAALDYVRKRRPCVCPNYGFVKQLQAFEDCVYEPSSNCKPYLSWKRKQHTDVTNFLAALEDTTPVIPDQLFINSDFPTDPQQAESLLGEVGITHVLSISPAKITPTVVDSVKHQHINVSNDREAVLFALPEACKYIAEALGRGGKVLVHSLVESRANALICAYLMYSRKIPLRKSFAVLEEALPFFRPTRDFSRHLELFEACKYAPAADHPLVKAWEAETLSRRARSLSPSSNLHAMAALHLKDNGIDMTSFGNTLMRLQNPGLVGQG